MTGDGGRSRTIASRAEVPVPVGPFSVTKLYSPESAAEVLELDPATVRRLAVREGLDVLRFNGKTIRLRGDQLQELVERARCRAPALRGVVAAARASETAA
jgi:hypothetical protein